MYGTRRAASEEITNCAKGAAAPPHPLPRPARAVRASCPGLTCLFQLQDHEAPIRLTPSHMVTPASIRSSSLLLPDLASCPCPFSQMNYRTTLPGPSLSTPFGIWDESVVTPYVNWRFHTPTLLYFLFLNFQIKNKI